MMREVLDVSYCGTIDINAENVVSLGLIDLVSAIIDEFRDTIYGDFYPTKEEFLDAIKGRIPWCKICLYFTKDKCEIEEAYVTAEKLSIGEVNGNDLRLKRVEINYGEDFKVSEFLLGGQDLVNVFRQHKGEYCHFVLSLIRNTL